MMMTGKNFRLTREKHLDHMVKVVPFIVLCYAVQSFIIFRASPTHFSTIILSALGCLIAVMIVGFVTYDLKHEVIFLEDKMSCHFFHSQHSISYADIFNVEVKSPSETFSTLSLKTRQGKFTFYFVDDAEKIRIWLEEKKYSELNKAA